MPDDLQEQEELLFKRLKSFYGIIPSTDFDSTAYYFFIEFASADELESDIVQKDTLIKITHSLGHSTDKWDWLSWILKTPLKAL